MAHQSRNLILFLLHFLFLIGLGSVSLAQTPVSFGHNLALSDETLKQKDFTFGTYYIGAGLTDKLTVGTSPWMILGYNLDNIIVRYRGDLFQTEFVHQLAYFKSNEKYGNAYEQTSISYWLGKAFKTDRYKVVLSLNYMYFYNEERPFSLRREPFKDEAAQFTLSTLHVFEYSEAIYLQLELGILGLNYSYPNLSAGASWFYKPSPHWSFQVGGSISKRFTGPQRTDYVIIKNTENYMGDSIHPEIQVQYWF